MELWDWVFEGQGTLATDFALSPLMQIWPQWPLVSIMAKVSHV